MSEEIELVDLVDASGKIQNDPECGIYFRRNNIVEEIKKNSF